jgi:hypothetical protein
MTAINEIDRNNSILEPQNFLLDQPWENPTKSLPFTEMLTFQESEEKSKNITIEGLAQNTQTALKLTSFETEHQGKKVFFI